MTGLFWGTTAITSLTAGVNEHCDEQTFPHPCGAKASGICVTGFLFLRFISQLKSITSFAAARVTPTGRNEWNSSTSMFGYWNQINAWILIYPHTINKIVANVFSDIRVVQMQWYTGGPRHNGVKKQDCVLGCMLMLSLHTLTFISLINVTFLSYLDYFKYLFSSF